MKTNAGTQGRALAHSPSSATATAPTLHPSEITPNARPWQRTFDVPPAVAQFGFYPDTEALLPGDLILTRVLQPDLISRFIARFQRRLSVSNQWTHAAMYMGARGQIVESTFESLFGSNHGVKVGLLSDYFMDHEILVRRLPDAFVCQTPRDPMACVNARWHMVTAAMQHIRKPYGFFQLPQFITKKVDMVRRNRQHKNFVCSTLYVAAVADGVQRVIGDGQESPAELAQSHVFDTVKISWVRIETRTI